METPSKKAKYGVAVFNFDGKVQHGLSLSIGDTVQIEGECCGWFGGYTTKNKIIQGIFPVSYVHLKECRIDIERSDDAMIMMEYPVVSEVCYVLREWSIIWKQMYMMRNVANFVIIGNLMTELIDLRRELISGTLTHDQMYELKSKITAKIDWGNKLLNLDLVPRINNEQVDMEKISPVELFRLHQKSTYLSKSATMRGSTFQNRPTYEILVHQLVLMMRYCTGNIGQEVEIHFCLFDGKLLKSFSEQFIIRMNRSGMLSRNDKQQNCAAVFTDLGEKDFKRDTFLVALIYRLGSLKEGETSKIPIMTYKRPYGCGVNKISDLFDESAEKVFSMKVFLCSESEFPSLPENLIKKQISLSTKSLASNFSICFSLKLFHGDLSKAREEDPLLFKGIAVATKIGFPDVIMPDTLRNDLYLTLVKGEFEKGSKSAPKNIEVRVTVVDKAGKDIMDCLSPGAGDMNVTEYNSSIFYHSNSPRWNETIRLAIPVEIFHGSHIRLEFRHCSRKDRTEKKLIGFSFIKLGDDDTTTLCDGQHELFLYKCDDMRRLRSSEIPYVVLPTSPAEFNPEKSYLYVNHPHFQRAEKELMVIETVLCSTKLTQNADLLDLLKWKSQPQKIYNNLEKLRNSDGEETIKFLQDVLDALFNMISTDSGDALKSQLVFKGLVHIFNLLEDNKFEHFKPVLDAYIENNFSGPLVYRELLGCLRETLDHLMSTTGAPSVQEQFQKCFKVFGYMSRCIVESRLLYIRAFGDSNPEEFKCLITDVFDMINKVLAINSDVISTTQGTLLQYLPSFLLQLTRVLLMTDLSQIITSVITSIPRNAPKDLDRIKLKFMKNIAKSPFFSTYDSKADLLPLYVSQLKRHLVNRTEIKLCISILSELLNSLHSDQHLNVHLRPNVQVILDGLLGVVMETLLMADKTSYNYGHLVSCFASMLKIMDEQTYRQVVARYADKRPLKEFLIRLLSLLNELARKEVFPKDWFIMKLATNHLILLVVQHVSQTICEQFLHGDDFDITLCKTFFHLAVSFLTQSCLQLEQFSAAKRQKIKDVYGDMRVSMAHKILSMWHNLGDMKIHFLPCLVGPFLEMTLIPETELRNATLPIFFDMMECEQNKYGNFQKVENELIDKLDILLNEEKGDYEYKQLFNTILLNHVQNVSGWQETGTAFVQSVARLLERLLDYRSILESEDNREKRMTCTMNLLNFYKVEVNRKEMYVRYIYKLFDLHLSSGNHTEAAFTLELHAELLSWGDQLLPEDACYSSQLEWQRKEMIYLKIIKEFDKGKSWEYGLPFCEKLSEVYKEKIMYSKLSEILQTQAEFYQKILRQHRPEPEYFRVGFYGLGFPLFLRNKEFVYRGNEYEKLTSFQQRLQSEFNTATILSSNSPPNDSVKMADRQCIQICNVKPMAEIEPCFLEQGVPETVRSFYRVNHVQKFQLDRPFHRGEKNDRNEFKTLFLERTMMTTCSKLPGILRWFEVDNTDSIQLSPVEVAIDTMERMNHELRQLVIQYTAETSLSINPLTMRLNGVIDAAVMGGVAKYQEAFFTEEFLSQNADHLHHVRQLKFLFTEQVHILERAMYLHRKLAPADVQPLHRRLEELFAKMKHGIRKPDSPLLRHLETELDSFSKHGSMSSLSSQSPHGSNRSSGVYCESFADNSSFTDQTIPEDQKSMKRDRTNLSAPTLSLWEPASPNVGSDKIKTQRPESYSNATSHGSTSSTLSQLTICSAYSSSSSVEITFADGTPSTPLTPSVHTGTPPRSMIGLFSRSNREPADRSSPVLPPKRSASAVTASSTLSIVKIKTSSSRSAVQTPPPIPARNSVAHLTIKSPFRDRKQPSDPTM